MRVSLISVALTSLLALALLLAGCGGGSGTPGSDVGTLTLTGSSGARALIYTPSADIAPLLGMGSVYARFDGATPAILSDVVLYKDVATGTWYLPVDNTAAYVGVAPGTYSGVYNARVYVYDPRTGEKSVPPVISVQLSVVINEGGGGGGGTPPPPPWSN